MKISLARISTKNLAALVQRIIATSNSGKYPVIAGNPLFAKLEDEYEFYGEVYTKQTYSGKGKEVAAADEVRDLAYNNLKAFLDGYRRISTVPNYEKAEALYQVFLKYGLDLPRLSYAEQTAQMVKLLEELSSTENQNKLSALFLQPAYNEMQDTHEAFETLFAEQAGPMPVSECLPLLRPYAKAWKRRPGLSLILSPP